MYQLPQCRYAVLQPLFDKDCMGCSYATVSLKGIQVRHVRPTFAELSRSCHLYPREQTSLNDREAMKLRRRAQTDASEDKGLQGQTLRSEDGNPQHLCRHHAT